MDKKEAVRRARKPSEAAYVTVWRKMPVGQVVVGSGNIPFESAVLMTVAETVHADRDRAAHTKMDDDRTPEMDAVITDCFEAEFEGHRVQVRMGDAVDIESA